MAKKIESVLSKQQLKDVATGDCYYTAFNLLEYFHKQGKKVKMIHGRPINRSEEFSGLEYGHAWVEVTDDVHLGNTSYSLEFCQDEVSGLMPSALYYMMGQIDREKNVEYTYEEACEMTRIHGTYGPWEN